jgi:hypothetical protein
VACNATHQKCGLADISLVQAFGWTFKAQLTERMAAIKVGNVIGLFKDGARGWTCVKPTLAHAHGLRALAGRQKNCIQTH